MTLFPSPTLGAVDGRVAGKSSTHARSYSSAKYRPSRRKESRLLADKAVARRSDPQKRGSRKSADS